MNLAILIMILTALPVFYYYYTLYRVNEKTKYLIGIFAGVWAFIGVLLANAGIIGFSYFIIYILLITIVYIYGLVMRKLDEGYEEAEEEEYEVEWPTDRWFPNMTNIMMGIVVLGVVLLMYMAFFMTSVSPARVDDHSGFDEKGETFKRLPNAYKYEYKSALYQSYFVVVTVRGIPLNQGHLDSVLDYAKGDVEDYIKEEYDRDASLELKDKDTIKIKGHDAVRHTYKIQWNELFNLRKGEMVLEAFFYHEDFEIIIIGYVYPEDVSGAKARTERLEEDIEC